MDAAHAALTMPEFLVLELWKEEEEELEEMENAPRSSA